MRRVLAVLFAAAALSGCVSTGYYRDHGAADYYYERDGGYAGHASYSYYGGGWGYSPYYSYGGFYPSYGYGYYGYPAFGFNSWYGGSWYYPGYDYYDSVWWHHQQAQARQRQREYRVRSENAAIAAMPRAAGPSRGGAMTGSSRSGRFGAPPEAGRSAGPDARSWRNADESRQVRTGTVDPYYGTPRQRRGVDAPERNAAPLGGREAMPRGGAMPQRPAGGGLMPARSDRAPAPLFRGERAPAPIRSSEPAFDRAPSPAPSFNSPRMAPSVSPPPRAGDGGRIRER
ncbi:hypothetical protein [Tahibacter harae]|uniref:Uncharacterized protein n=1 Tax=Tahibacter harae TaxID=2963937 RepID=A0ABT1QTN5_9GAMM|nr:hypothetical protein [Tahibacter harae]MCQ4165636.1 hypothetical protein [Tahibacter harae]